MVDCLLLNEAEVLEDDADGPPQVGNLLFLDPFQLEAVDMDAAAGGRELRGQQVDDGGFSGAGGADQEDEFAIFNLEVDAADGFGAVVVGFGDILKFDPSLLLLYLLRLGSGRSGYSIYTTRLSRELRYFLTISATLNTMAWSNSRRSSPVSFLIFSSR